MSALWRNSLKGDFVGFFVKVVVPIKKLHPLDIKTFSIAPAAITRYRFTLYAVCEGEDEQF
jgi:hypothetical protein